MVKQNSRRSANWSKIDKLNKTLIIINGFTHAILLATIARRNILFNNIEAKSNADLHSISENMFRNIGSCLADGSRGTFGAGGDGVYDTAFYILNGFLQFIVVAFGGLSRKTAFLTKEEASLRENNKKLLEPILDKSGNHVFETFIVNGLRIKKYKYYVESQRSHYAQKLAKITIGISIVTAALTFNTLMSTTKFNNCNPGWLKWLQGTTFGQGLVGALFSFTFVFGYLLFAFAASGFYRNQMEKISDWPEWGKKLLNITLLIGFVGLSAGLASAASQFKTSEIVNGVTHALFGNIILSNLLAGLSVLLGIAVIGRMLIENMLKRDVVKLFARYNSLMGVNGSEDAFVNDHINQGYKSTWLETKDGSRHYVVVPGGKKLLNHKKNVEVNDVNILNRGHEELKNEYAFYLSRNKNGDDEYHYFNVENSTHYTGKWNRRRQKIELALYSILFYAITIGLYGVVYLTGKFGVPFFQHLVGHEEAAIMITTIVNDIFYLAAIMFGMQAVNALFKIANMSIFNINFEERVELMDESTMESRIKRNQWFMLGSTIASLVVTGVMIGLVILFSEGKIKIEVGLSLIMLGMIMLWRIITSITLRLARENVIMKNEIDNVVRDGDKLVAKLNDASKENCDFINFTNNVSENGKPTIMLIVDVDNVAQVAEILENLLKASNSINNDFNIVIRNSRDNTDSVYEVKVENGVSNDELQTNSRTITMNLIKTIQRNDQGKDVIETMKNSESIASKIECNIVHKNLPMYFFELRNSNKEISRKVWC